MNAKKLFSVFLLSFLLIVPLSLWFYWAMLCDTAWCLAMERERTGRAGGFTTPSVALGPVLREQLRLEAGVHFGIGMPACDR